MRNDTPLINFIFCCTLFSCFPSGDVHREEGKVFHASIPSGPVGGLYFGLYGDQEYQICAVGGIGQTCYAGKYQINKDTLTLLDLNSEIPLKSNRLLIKRYEEPKYGAFGEVIQLDKQNELIIGGNEMQFLIRMDSINLVLTN